MSGNGHFPEVLLPPCCSNSPKSQKEQMKIGHKIASWFQKRGQRHQDNSNSETSSMIVSPGALHREERQESSLASAFPTLPFTIHVQHVLFEETIRPSPIPWRTMPCSTTSGSTTCSICLEEYQCNDSLLQLPCQHIHHTACMERWVKRGNGSCPDCRAKVMCGTTKKTRPPRRFYYLPSSKLCALCGGTFLPFKAIAQRTDDDDKNVLYHRSCLRGEWNYQQMMLESSLDEMPLDDYEP